MTLGRLAMDGKQRRESDDGVAIVKALSANVLGRWLVLIGAAALAISMFLPLAQPAGWLPIVGNNTLFQEIGWRVFFLPFFLVTSGYHASQGKPGARWFLISLCAIAAVGIALLGSDKGLRTLYPVGPGGAVDTTQRGVVTSLDIAIYVAAAGVAVAFIGALTFRRSAGKEVANVGPTRQWNTGVHETRVPAGPEGNPQPKQAVRPCGEHRASDRQRAHNVVLSASG
jgi:hypothetical protein